MYFSPYYPSCRNARQEQAVMSRSEVPFRLRGAKKRRRSKGMILQGR